MSPFNIRRYPPSGNKSLCAWNATDEHLLRHHADDQGSAEAIAIYGDRFGYLTCHLVDREPLVITDLASQRYAIERNLAEYAAAARVVVQNAIDPLPRAIGRVLMNVPKSLDVFRLYLYQISQSALPSTQVAAAFMTRHFTPRVLSVASEYFGEVKQSRAWKKSRLLLLEKPLPFREMDRTHHIPFGEVKVFRQYWGVFSAGHIDHASRFFIQNMAPPEGAGRILDLASGNGVLAWAAACKAPRAELHLLDDSYLAVQSSRWNVGEGKGHFHHANGLARFPDGHFDWVVSNPPFHFGHEVDVSVPLGLFAEVARCLSTQGRFQLVANRHLNYGKHLSRIFNKVGILAANDKFEVLEGYF